MCRVIARAKAQDPKQTTLSVKYSGGGVYCITKPREASSYKMMIPRALLKQRRSCVAAKKCKLLNSRADPLIYSHLCERKRLWNQQELKTAASEAWQSITREDPQQLLISKTLRLQTAITCQRHPQSSKHDCLLCPKYYDALKWGSCVKEVPEVIQVNQKAWDLHFNHIKCFNLKCEIWRIPGSS